MTIIKSFLRSLRHALAGIAYAFREERNFQIELVLGSAALVLAFFFPLSHLERAVIVFLIGFVLSLELINTAFERMLDMLKPRVHPYVKAVKDMVAGAVLIGSIVAIGVACFIFGPIFWMLIGLPHSR